MPKHVAKTAIVLVGLLSVTASAHAQYTSKLYECDTEVMAAAQAILDRRTGEPQATVEKAVLEHAYKDWTAYAKRGVAKIYAIDDEIFANSLGMGLIDDVQTDCMGK